MLEDDLEKLNNLVSRKKNYESCIKCLTHSQGPLVVTNRQTGHTDFIDGRRFAMISRTETNSTGFIDEKAEPLMRAIFEQLLADVQKEIDAVELGSKPGKESEYKSFYTEVVHPHPERFKKESDEPSTAMKWVIAIVIGFLLLLFMNFML
jgi:hypothetical protein